MPLRRRLSKLCRSFAIAFAVLLAAVIGSPLHAQPSSQWIGEGRDDVLRNAVVDAFKKTVPGAKFAFDVGDFVLDPIVAAATTRGTSEEKIDAWVRGLGQARVSAAFPAYGLVLAGGKIIIGGATYTVEGMIQATHDQEVLAILAGRGAGGPLDRVNNVLADTPFVSVLNQGVTLENIGALPRTELDRYWNRYVSQVRDLYGRANADVVKSEVWPKLLALWETQRAKANLEQVVGQLDRAIAEAQAQAEARAQAGSTPFAGDLSGTWKWSCCGGAYSGTFTLVQSGERLTGAFDDGSTLTGYIGASIALTRTGSFGQQNLWLGASSDGKTLTGEFLGTRDMSVGNDFRATRSDAAAGGATALGATAAVPTAGTDYYVFVLKDIGLVAATPDEVRTRPACQWSGGGPPPCTAPATAIGTLGGPYPSVAAARADMKTKLDCQSGYWGTFLPLGSGRAWLQNNIGGGDCRSVKQL
jgi:hypothetical protein